MPSESTWSARTCRLFTPGVRRALVGSVGTTAALCSLTRFRRTSRTAATYCPAQSVHGRLFFLTPLAAAASRRPMPAGARRALVRRIALTYHPAHIPISVRGRLSRHRPPGHRPVHVRPEGRALPVGLLCASFNLRPRTSTSVPWLDRNTPPLDATFLAELDAQLLNRRCEDILGHGGARCRRLDLGSLCASPLRRRRAHAHGQLSDATWRLLTPHAPAARTLPTAIALPRTAAAYRPAHAPMSVCGPALDAPCHLPTVVSTVRRTLPMSVRLAVHVCPSLELTSNVPRHTVPEVHLIEDYLSRWKSVNVRTYGMLNMCDL
ncbi:hypothetical protein GGX14DRAFT_567877 [Mycena pura]|uniref:Uncharacterized protein n=1 Tax=Mycena pura TaxID=153505 RepID=A0AAD6V9I6_9AGAR|nr:hypothetical protein GGX14DRAFT_567877 [Mycena pura]